MVKTMLVWWRLVRRSDYRNWYDRRFVPMCFPLVVLWLRLFLQCYLWSLPILSKLCVVVLLFSVWWCIIIGEWLCWFLIESIQTTSKAVSDKLPPIKLCCWWCSSLITTQPENITNTDTLAITTKNNRIFDDISMVKPKAEGIYL